LKDLDYSHKTKIIGVETTGANDCYQSFREKRIVKIASTNAILKL
jgi:threonine dehydratase